MSKKIILPTAETAKKMIADSWENFKKMAEENGLPLNNPELCAFAQDMFVAGYSYGHNDCLNIVRGQLEAIDMIGDIFGQGN